MGVNIVCGYTGHPHGYSRAQSLLG